MAVVLELIAAIPIAMDAEGTRHAMIYANKSLLSEEVHRCDPLHLDGCASNDCALQEYADRCEGCMCYSPGSGLKYCDGGTGTPGEQNSGCTYEARDHGILCDHHWQCKSKYCVSRFRQQPYTPLVVCALPRWLPVVAQRQCTRLS